MPMCSLSNMQVIHQANIACLHLEALDSTQLCALGVILNKKSQKTKKSQKNFHKKEVCSLREKARSQSITLTSVENIGLGNVKFLPLYACPQMIVKTL